MTKGKDIGALWVKQGQKGQYLSGYVEINGVKISILCFVNGHKKEAKHPDYRILPSEPRPQQERPPRSYEEQVAPLNELGQAPQQKQDADPNEDLLDVGF